MFLPILHFRITALTTHQSVRLTNSLCVSSAVEPHPQSSEKKQLSNTIPQDSIFNYTNYKCNNKMSLKSLQSNTFKA